MSAGSPNASEFEKGFGRHRPVNRRAHVHRGSGRMAVDAEPQALGIPPFGHLAPTPTPTPIQPHVPPAVMDSFGAAPGPRGRGRGRGRGQGHSDGCGKSRAAPPHK